MTEDGNLYKALAARDARFDGVFFVGVSSTGIYCRPICTAKTPKAANCRFFRYAHEAEKEGFRPCLRCRPELAPGYAPVDDSGRVAQLLIQRLEEGAIEHDSGLDRIAAQFDLSGRQFRRVVQKEFGVSPIELLQTRRMLLAKQLLTETQLPITTVAFASGFSSLRRFNDAFQRQYKMTPSGLRKDRTDNPAIAQDSSVMHLSYRTPYDWDGILAFLKGRMIKGVEHITGDEYARTIRIGDYTGWVRVRHVPGKNSLSVEFAHGLTPVLPVLLNRLRDLFDLRAQPDLIAAHLQRDKRLKPMIARNAGLRVPGAFDGFEMAMRAILGQQVSVKSATTLSCRLAATFGEPVETPFPDLTHLAPTASRMAQASVDDIARHGIIAARARSIIALAQAIESGALDLGAGADPAAIIPALEALPGIGPWTAHYIAMRALRWPDAFPKEDLILRANLGQVSARQAEEISQNWRPWRSYATLHIWRNPPGQT